MKRPRAAKTKQQGINAHAVVTLVPGATVPLATREPEKRLPEEAGASGDAPSPAAGNLTYEAADLRRSLAALESFERRVREVGPASTTSGLERVVPPSL